MVMMLAVCCKNVIILIIMAQCDSLYFPAPVLNICGGIVNVNPNSLTVQVINSWSYCVHVSDVTQSWPVCCSCSQTGWGMDCLDVGVFINKLLWTVLVVLLVE